MKRKLASVQTVLALDPIPNADAIELARIQGWQCVVKKGEFQNGDRGVFFEIDAMPPDDDRFRFLWRTKSDGQDVKKPENFRLRTMRLRGALSQGLLLRLTEFPEIELTADSGQDVTDVLGVTKWEPVLPISDEIDGPFLPGVPKTDEMRVQSFPAVLQEMAGLPYVATQKCDGSSVTFGCHGHTGDFTVCGRNWSIKRGSNATWRVVERLGLEETLLKTPQMVVQAELVGPGIQKNRLGLKETQAFAFNVYDRDRRCYLDHDAAASFLAEAGVPMVKVVERGESFAHDQDSLLQLAEGHYPGTQNEREGIVIRPLCERHSDVLGGRLSFKVISNRFLLKGGD